MKMNIPCGDGEQKVKWLGLVAAQRYALMVPQGRSRMREASHATTGFYLPKTISQV